MPFYNVLNLRLLKTKNKLQVPEETVKIISYLGPSTVNPVSLKNSPHAILLQ